MIHNSILAGVGGQGILYITRLMHDAALMDGFGVMASETHGMAQRGGSVVSHLRIGDPISPLVRKGTADLLMVFSKDEAYRTLSFLKSKGSLVINGQDGQALGPDITRYLTDRGANFYHLDADAKADDLGASLAGNIILLGFALRCVPLPVTYENIRKAIEQLTRPSFRDINLKALKLGFEAIG